MENRSIIELLQIARKELIERNQLESKTPYYGMCQLINTIYLSDIISTREYVILKYYLKEHKPQFRNLKRKHKYGGYWWKQRGILPRYIWLTKRIWIEKIKSIWR